LTAPERAGSKGYPCSRTCSSSRGARNGEVDRVLVACEAELDATVLPLLQTYGAKRLAGDVVPRSTSSWRTKPRRTRSVAFRPSRSAELGRRLASGSPSGRLAGVAGVMVLLLKPRIPRHRAHDRLDEGRSIVFHQRRVGRNGRPFEICRFRTMRTEPEAELLLADGIDRAIDALKAPQPGTCCVAR
jgi:Bacterial sugar transferase